MKELKINESLEFRRWEVLRVPGGWIYSNKNNDQMIFIKIPGIDSQIELDINDEDMKIIEGLTND